MIWAALVRCRGLRPVRQGTGGQARRPQAADISWHLIHDQADYAFARPSPIAKKTRALKLRARMAVAVRRSNVFPVTAGNTPVR